MDRSAACSPYCAVAETLRGMATLPSRQDDLATLADAGREDEVVARAARVLAAHFASSAKAPKSGPLAASADLVAAVARCFPTPFAEEFGRWAATGGASLQGDERTFASAFDALQEMWR